MAMTDRDYYRQGSQTVEMVCKMFNILSKQTENSFPINVYVGLISNVFGFPERLAKNIKEKCVMCTEMQYSNGKLYLEHLQYHHPEDHALFLKKYDPESHIGHFLKAAPLLPRVDDFNEILFF